MNPEILNLLLSGEVRIVFRKKTNGLLRNLLATLNKDDIPPEQYSTLASVLQNTSSDLIVAWDIESNDWRSFYLSSVIKLFQTEMAKKVDLSGDMYLDDLINAAESAVIGYEKYLLDKLDYKELAVIMGQLRELLPFENYDRESET